MKSPQPSIVTPAPSPAPINHSPTTDPTTTAQPSSVAQAPTIMQLTASTASGPPSRRLRSTGHVPDPRRLLATVMLVTDFDDDYTYLLQGSTTACCSVSIPRQPTPLTFYLHQKLQRDPRPP
eukprot:3333643-Pleurochrysis_carterae.AAC.1